MKILVLMGSYRKNGNTDRIARMIIESMRREAAQVSEPLEVETLHLGHMNIQLCRGCRVCFDRGEDKCPLHDDMREVKARILSADGILIGSPVYVDNVNGITKNAIDRLAHVCHRPEFAGKTVYMIATTGTSPTQHALQTMAMAFSTWGATIAGQAGFVTGALMKAEEMQSRYQARTDAIGRKFFSAIHRKTFRRPSFRSLMTFKIQQLCWLRSVGDMIDYTYWKNRGWLEPGCDFYIPHQASRVKVLLARAAGQLIAPFVS